MMRALIFLEIFALVMISIFSSCVPAESLFEIYIPSIDVRAEVYKGSFPKKSSSSERILFISKIPIEAASGISFTLPGEEGTTVIFGQHLKGGKLFGSLEKIKVGDLVHIFLKTENQLTYEVFRTIPYGTKGLSEDIFKGKSRLILMTCSEEPRGCCLVICQLIKT